MTNHAFSNHDFSTRVLPLETVRVSASSPSVRRHVWWLRATMASASGVFAYVLAGAVWAAVVFVVSGFFWTMLTNELAQEVPDSTFSRSTESAGAAADRYSARSAE